MKTEQEIRERGVEISTQIDLIYRSLEKGDTLTDDFKRRITILRSCEELLEWVLED